MKFWLLMLCVLSLTACQLGIEDENADEIDSIVRSTTGENTEVDNDGDPYDFTLTGSSNVLKLEGDLENIAISGSNNIVTIMNDDLVDELTISGEANTVKLAPELTTRITKVNISNEGNTVSITEYVNESYNEALNTLNGSKVAP